MVARLSTGFRWLFVGSFLGLAFAGCQVADKDDYTFGSAGGSGGSGGSGGLDGGDTAGSSGASPSSGGSGGSVATGGAGAAGGDDESGGTGAVGGADPTAGTSGTGGKSVVDPRDVCPLAERSCAEDGLLGPCADGVQSCLADGRFGACSVEPKSADSCEQGDDGDCDGLPNQNPDCACIEGATRSCAVDGALGNCAKGEQTCDAEGSWGACSITPEASDSCTTTGDDADCDGTPNSGCPCVESQSQACGPSVARGICKRGTSTCVDEVWGACKDAVMPKARDCTSALDNDCDGKADNTIDTVCQCAASGSEACGDHPGLDGHGRCKAGQRSCVVSVDKTSSSWGACTGSVGPATVDLCTTVGDDADCNGTLNQGCTCISGASSTCATVHGSSGDCAATKLTCTNAGKWPAASACASLAAELCNTDGRDENCDGRVNEGCTCTTGESCGPCKTCDATGACVVNKATNTDCGVCSRCNAQGLCAPGYVGAQDPTGCNAAATCALNVSTAAQSCDANGICRAPTTNCPTGCTGTACTPARCGDGIVNQASETCDDGNALNRDTCSTACKPCGGIVGPLLEGIGDDNSRYFGLQLTATANATIYSFIANTMGEASSAILAERAADGTRTIRYEIAIPAGASANTYLVEWPLTAGRTYVFYQSRRGNGRYAFQSTGSFPNTNAPGIRVEGSWDEGTDNFDPPIPESVSVTLWRDFSDIRTCQD